VPVADHALGYTRLKDAEIDESRRKGLDLLRQGD
jgi:hypothetical protein